MPPLAPTRVLYVLDSLASAGTTDLVGFLVARLDRRRFHPEVVALQSGTAAEHARPLNDRERLAVERFRELDVRAATIGLDVRRPMWRRLRPFVKTLLERRVGIVHAHSRPADLWATWAGLAARTPVRLYSRQATYGGMGFSTRARYALTARAASRVVAVSEAVAQHLRHREGVPPARIELIHDGIDLEALARVTPREKTRAALGLAPDTPVVGCVASLTERKGQRFLIEAAPQILARFPNARFLLIGDGPERTALEDRIARLSLSHAFRLVGWRRDLADWIAALDVFVLPSLWEGLNLSLLTACALGRAVVATNLLANREIVESGVSGLLPTPTRPAIDVPTLDARRLGDAVAALLASPTRREQLGEAARRRVSQHFGADAMAARHEDLYERLLGATRSPRARCDA